MAPLSFVNTATESGSAEPNADLMFSSHTGAKSVSGSVNLTKHRSACGRFPVNTDLVSFMSKEYLTCGFKVT